ncbi:MAG: hypothetical protein LRZ84_14550 [Desertifilum sp.]|nr:hypothetical protein [Desertifilum sp.]
MVLPTLSTRELDSLLIKHLVPLVTVQDGTNPFAPRDWINAALLESPLPTLKDRVYRKIEGRSAAIDFETRSPKYCFRVVIPLIPSNCLDLDSFDSDRYWGTVSDRYWGTVFDQVVEYIPFNAASLLHERTRLPILACMRWDYTPNFHEINLSCMVQFFASIQTDFPLAQTLDETELYPLIANGKNLKDITAWYYLAELQRRQYANCPIR